MSEWENWYRANIVKSVSPVEITTPQIRQKIRRNIDADPNDFFYIAYTNVKGEPKRFVFALLPAIDVSGGRGMGTMSGVPEVKPGIVIRTSMRQKNIPVPGGVPVVQTIGVDNTILQVVGAFIGSERNTGPTGSTRGDVAPLYEGSAPLSAAGSSETRAREFMTQVVHSGRPVVFKAKSVAQTSERGPAVGMDLEYKGVVVNFKFYAARRNRSYYTLDLLLTEYDINR